MSQETLNIILSSVVVPVLIALAAYIVAYLKKKSEELQNRINNQKISKYITIAEDAICKSVEAVSQTFVDALKDEGTFDKEAAEIAFSMAKTKVLTILSVEAKEALSTVFGDLNEWLDSQIEYYVRLNKVDIIIDDEDEGV